MYMIISITFNHYSKLFNSIFYMIRTLPTHATHPHSVPFTDIINHPNDHLAEELQKELGRITENQHQYTESSKENHSEEDDLPCNDKTIKKEHIKFDSHALSSKTIRDEFQNTIPQIDDNPEFDLLIGNAGEVHRVLNCSIPFQEVKGIFIEQTKKEKLYMCQNTDNFVTVKKESLSSCKCIIKIWTNNQADSVVYQLRCLNRESKRLKIILVEGEQSKFNIFAFKIMKRLARQGIIKLTTREQIQIFFCDNSINAENIKKQVTKLSGKIKKSKAISAQAESLIQKAKQQFSRLKQHVKAIPQLQFTLAYQRQFQSLFFKYCGLFGLYQIIYKKDYQLYQKKRDTILKKWNLFDIFKQLQISEHFDQYRKRKQILRNTNKQFDNLPYMPAVKCLQQIKSLRSPSAMLEKVLIFQSKVKSCYNQYFINKMRLSDMEDHLPITIYCVLAMENEENLLANTKMMLAYLSKQEQFQWEKKILTNLEAAFEFICFEWEV